MATRKKSESGAYMSQYDTEVEKRLKALESQTHPDRGCLLYTSDAADE